MRKLVPLSRKRGLRYGALPVLALLYYRALFLLDVEGQHRSRFPYEAAATLFAFSLVYLLWAVAVERLVEKRNQ